MDSREMRKVRLVTTKMITSIILFAPLLAGYSLATPPAPATLSLKAHYLERSKSDPTRFTAKTKTLRWDASKTAIIICDMWDKHWCQSASNRVAEMAPVMNEVVKTARQKGVFIIHAPSDTMDYYKDAPQRKLAQNAPTAAATSDVKSWRTIDPAKEPPLPIDDS